MKQTARYQYFQGVVAVLVLLATLFPVSSAFGQSLMGTKNESVNPSLSYAVQNPYLGIWISGSELANLPTSGTAWNALKSAADSNAGTPDISNQDDNNDVYVLAKALVYARTGDTAYRTAVISNLKLAMGTETAGRTLALGRNLLSYVISADLINLPAADPTFNQTFRTWLSKTLSETLTDGHSLRQTAEERPNNWGTHASASRTAVALYLGDKAELDRTALVFRGYLGDRSAYKSFIFGTDLTWQCDPNNPVAINPKGCAKSGHLIDGALPDEMRRGGSFQYPPVSTGYPWEALQGAMAEGYMLTRAGYPAFQWSDQALLRAVQYLYSISWPAAGDDAWQLWLINRAYGTTYNAVTPTGHGKNMGWTDWTFGQGSASAPAPTAAPTTAPTAAPTAQPTSVPTTAPTAQPPVNPTAAPQPTTTVAPSGSSLIKSITFEDGALINAASGGDKLTGTVNLDNTNALQGVYSESIASTGDSFLESSFSATDTLYVTFQLKLKALPSSSSRIFMISDAGTTVGNILLQSDGSLKLRNGTTTIGAASQVLNLNTIYNVGIRQSRGSGSNAVLQIFVTPAGQAFGAPFASTSTGTWTSQADRIKVGATNSGAINALFDNIWLDTAALH